MSKPIQMLNKVELTGLIGRASSQTVADKTITRLTVATDFTFKDKNDCPVIETNWHNVVLFGSEKTPAPQEFTKGRSISLSGRIRYTRFSREGCEDKIIAEIYADPDSIVLHEKNSPWEPQKIQNDETD